MLTSPPVEEGLNIRACELFKSTVVGIIPDLVALALDSSAPNHVKQLALRLSEKIWQQRGLDPRFEGVKLAILSHLVAVLEGQEGNRHRELISDLRDLIRDGFLSNGENPAYTFPWGSTTQFIQEVVARFFKSIVQVAIFETDRTLSAGAQAILNLVSQDGQYSHSCPKGRLPLTYPQAGSTAHSTRVPWVGSRGLLLFDLVIQRHLAPGTTRLS